MALLGQSESRLIAGALPAASGRLLRKVQSEATVSNAAVGKPAFRMARSVMTSGVDGIQWIGRPSLTVPEGALSR